MLSLQTRKSVRMHTHTYTNEHLHTHALITSTYEIWIESKEEHQQIDTAGAAERRRRRIWCMPVYVCVCVFAQVCASACKRANVWQRQPRCSEKPIHTQNIVCCASACLPVWKLWKLQNQRAGHTPLTKDTTTTIHTLQMHAKKQRTQRNENINGELASANNYNRNKQMQDILLHSHSHTHTHTSTLIMQRPQIIEMGKNHWQAAVLPTE